MKPTTKRIAALLLAALLSAGTLLTAVSCADTDGSGETESSATTGSNQNAESGTATEETTPPAYDTVEKQKFNRSFVFMTRESLIDDMYIEKMTGDLLDDSIYERNTQICEDFGIKIEYVTVNDSGEGVGYKLQNQVNANLDEFDVFFANKLSYNNCATANYCYNLNNVSSLALDQTWWDQGCNTNLSVGGKTYVMNGDINPWSMIMSSCMVFNKNLMKDLGKSVSDLNTKAQNGEWTLDVMLAYSKNVTSDLNGDGAINRENDRFGYTSWYMDSPYSMFYGAGGMFVENVDGVPELTFSTEDVTNIYEKLFEIFVTEKSNYITDVAHYDDAYGVFTDGRAMFCDVTLGKVELNIADKDVTYGILPIPKYDTHQEEYYAFINGATTLIMLAKNEADPEFSGTILEAMATYNYDNVTPKLFEVVTKLQAAQDPESAAMVDIILRNRVYDLGYFCDFDITNLVREKLKDGQAEISSNLASQKRAATNSLRTLILAFDKCD